MTETDIFEGGIATLSADSTPEFDSEAPFEINGVAIPVNTVVNGGQNVDHFFPEEVLQNATGLLEGAPIVKNFHDIEGQASADNVIGRVTNDGFQKGVGLVFEGEITDQDIAEKISHGFLDVSPSPARSLGEFNESMGAQRVDRLVDFRDIAVVANGQPGAKVEIGPNPAVEALSRDALSRGFDTLREHRSPPEQAQTNAQAVLDIRDKTDAMTETGWRRANQIADGEELSADVIQKMAQFNRHRDNTEFDNFSDIPDSRKGDDADNPWWEDNGTVAWLGWGGTAGIDWAIEQSKNMNDTNQSDTLQNDLEIHTPEFDTAEDRSWSKPSLSDFTEDSWDDLDAEVQNSIGDHFLGSRSGFPAENWGDMFLPVVDEDGTLILNALQNAKARAGQVSGLSGDDLERVISTINSLANENFEGAEFGDEETDTQSDDGTYGVWSPSSAASDTTNTMTDLSEKEQSVLRAAEDIEEPVEVLSEYQAAEQPEIVESDALEHKDEQIDEFADVFREVLSERTRLKESTLEAMDVDALANEFRNEDGEIEAETLSQTPETQNPPANPGGSTGKDTLSAEEKSEIEDKLKRADLLENRTPEHAETLRSEAAELAGVEDADEIEVDAL